MCMPPSPAVHLNSSLLPVDNGAAAAGASAAAADDDDDDDDDDAGGGDVDDRGRGGDREDDDVDPPGRRRREGRMYPYGSVERVFSLSYAHPNSMPSVKLRLSFVPSQSSYLSLGFTLNWRSITGEMRRSPRPSGLQISTMANLECKACQR